MSEEKNATEVKVFGNGPLRVHGPLQVTLPDGTVVEKENGASFCRCGLSTNKPFCDATHKRESWQG